MSRLLALVFLLGAGYWVWTVGLPWYRERNPPAADATRLLVSGSRRCVEAAESASGSFAAALREHARPPVDREAWAPVFLTVTGELAAAEAECGCDAEPCALGARAVDGLRELLLDFDGALRGGTVPLDAGARMERIDRLLAEARQSIDS